VISTVPLIISRRAEGKWEGQNSDGWMDGWMDGWSDEGYRQAGSQKLEEQGQG